MKKCISCNIYVDGDRTTCPFCQNALTGDASDYNWPRVDRLKKQAFIYKLQLMIVLTAIVVSLVLDYLLELNPGIHYGFCITVWGIVTEFTIKSFIKRRVVPAKVISISAVVISLLMGFTSYYYGFFVPVFYIAVPALIGATIIANFVFAFIDKAGNALVYLLCTIVIGIIPYVVLYVTHDKGLRLPWTICLIVSIVAFMGIIVFKGRKVLTELQKRFNF